jgi:hypothetical protein
LAALATQEERENVIRACRALVCDIDRPLSHRPPSFPMMDSIFKGNPPFDRLRSSAPQTFSGASPIKQNFGYVPAADVPGEDTLSADGIIDAGPENP